MAQRDAADASGSSADPPKVVHRFLAACGNGDVDTIAALLHPELVYTNVSLPSIRGGERVARLFASLMRRGMRADIHTSQLAADGDVVLTERTDILRLGPVHVGFWVCGTFQVRDGQIVLWRDHFAWMAFLFGMLRGLVGAIVPPLRPRLPAKLKE